MPRYSFFSEENFLGFELEFYFICNTLYGTEFYGKLKKFKELYIARNEEINKKKGIPSILNNVNDIDYFEIVFVLSQKERNHCRAFGV